MHRVRKKEREAEAKHQQPGANGCKRSNTTAKPKNNSKLPIVTDNDMTSRR
jgi:hypothetical protein